MADPRFCKGCGAGSAAAVQVQLLDTWLLHCSFNTNTLPISHSTLFPPFFLVANNLQEKDGQRCPTASFSFVTFASMHAYTYSFLIGS